MKKIIISSLLIVFVIITAVLFYFSNTNKKDLQNVSNDINQNDNKNVSTEVIKIRKEYEPISFPVIGDVHTDTVRLENAIKDFYEINPGTDVMVLNGDIVDEGLPEHYTAVKNTLINNNAMLPKILLKNIGNHEFFNYSKTTALTKEESDAHISRYLEFAGEENVYHDKWIKDYHFIFIGSEQTNTADVGNVTALISQDQLKWLKNKLAEKYKEGKPIFVFFHQPVRNTPPSQQGGWVSSNQSVEVYNILSKYPEVVLFSSHTHTYLVSNNMVYFNQPFTAVYTGATRAPLKPDENGVRRYSEESQGVYVEIRDGKLTVKARDFGKKSWIEGAVFTRDLN